MAAVEVGGPSFVVASGCSRGEDQPVAAAWFADQLCRDPARREVPSQTNDVGPKLFGREVGSRPGKVHQLRGRKKLAGAPRKEGQQLHLSTSQRQPTATIREYTPADVEVEAGQIPQAPLPKIEPRLQAPHVPFHPARVGIAGLHPVPVVAAAFSPQAAQGPIGEGDELSVDRDPLARIIEVSGVGHLALDQVELAHRLAGRAGAGHYADSTLPTSLHLYTRQQDGGSMG